MLILLTPRSRIVVSSERSIVSGDPSTANSRSGDRCGNASWIPETRSVNCVGVNVVGVPPPT